MKTTWTTGLVLVLALSVFGVQRAQATPFTNGSFEFPDVPSFGFGTVPTDWSVSGSTGDIVMAHTPNVFTLNATEGDQIVILNNDGNGSTLSLFQAFDTVATTQYQVLFDLSRETPGSGGANAPISVVATGNAASTNLFNSGSSWVTQIYNFTATGASTTLTFTRNSLGEGNSPVLDNVVINVVPEPSSLALFALGMIGLCRLWRKRSV